MPSPAITAVAIALIGAAMAAPPSEHPCAKFLDCSTCIAAPLCGWCSEPVVYPGNVTGAQCAGFNPHGPNPFACNGVYSTETCEAGWTCDLDNFTCVPAAKGAGKTKGECEADCINKGQVYACNHTTKKCEQVPAGTKGSSSHAVCEQECSKPSPHPAPPTPPTPPAEVYSCNASTGQCVKAEPGKGKSKELCEQQCKKSDGKKYFCETFTQKCIVVAPTFPGAGTKAECEHKCTPHPNPGPPPQFTGGTWRGIEIQAGYKVGEWDMEFTSGHAVMVDVAGATTIKGTPSHVMNGEHLDLWIKVTSGPGAGKTIKALGVPASRGPETKFLTAAFSAPGGKAPTSIAAAMKDETMKVFFLAQCAGTPECRFHMPSTGFRAHAHDAPQRFLGAQAEMDAVLGSGAAPGPDPCSQFAANCSFCLAHEYCGWCSHDVTYAGAKGTQCAGFQRNKSKSNSFVCSGRYSTLSCTAGYTCDKENYQCKPAQPGNGLPLDQCDALCKPTPAPTPPPPQYVCNMTTKQCHKCLEKECPGSMPEGTCEAACKKPKPGPHGLVKGIWRGIKIQHGYPLAEFDLVFNASSVTFFKDTKVDFEAKVMSLGGDVMIFETAAGEKYSARYTVADQGSMYEAMTIAVSAPGGQIPDSYSPAMETAGEYEMVVAKCSSTPCAFHHP